MKPEAQRIAIAEACGWIPSQVDHCWNNPSLMETRDELPDYLNDLNAILCEIRKRETDGGFAYHYCENLKGTILLRAGLKYPGLVGEFRIATAEADVHAEAFLRTLGKWKELL